MSREQKFWVVGSYSEFGVFHDLGVVIKVMKCTEADDELCVFCCEDEDEVLRRLVEYYQEYEGEEDNVTWAFKDFEMDKLFTRREIYQVIEAVKVDPT